MTDPIDLERLPRYGLSWNGPSEPLAVPLDNGYWTPWHLPETGASYPLSGDELSAALDSMSEGEK